MMKRICSLLLVLLVIVTIVLPNSAHALSPEDYKTMGLLPYKGKPYFTLGSLDKLGRPTWAHIQFHNFIDAKPDKVYKDPKTPINGKSGYLTDYLPGFKGNDTYYLIPAEFKQGYMQKVWSPSHLLSNLWTGMGANTVQNYGLLTSYADTGFPSDSRKGLVTLQDYERALDDWLRSSYNSKKEYQKADLVDYKIELIYQGDELVPRQIKLRYVGLTKAGKLKKIDLEGEESFDSYGIATVLIDNIAPNVTIDYLTGEVTGQAYVKKEEPANSSSATEEEDDSDEVYVYHDKGYYYYSAPDDNWDEILTENQAIEEGYAWDSLE